MRIFLTGATGLIGRHVTARALEQGHSVTAIVRSPHRLPPGAGKRLSIITGDFTDGETVRRSLPGHDAVINCAGALKAETAQEFRRINVEAACQLYTLAREAGARCFVHLGSMGVYALERGTTLTEGSREEPHPDWRGNYTSSKLEGDHALLKLAQASLPALVILRPSVVYGAGLDLPMGRLAIRLPGSFVLVFGRGRNTLPLTHAGNLADALLLASRREQHGVFNIVDDPSLVHSVYHSTLRRLRPGSPKPIYVPEGMILAAAKSFDLAKALMGRKGHVAYRMSRNMVPQPIDVSRAVHELGYRPRHDLAEAMRCTLQGDFA